MSVERFGFELPDKGGIVLRISGTKPADLTVAKATLDLVGAEFWQAVVSKKVASAPLQKNRIITHSKDSKTRIRPCMKLFI